MLDGVLGLAIFLVASIKAMFFSCERRVPKNPSTELSNSQAL
jgi:hypothetical protein